MAGIIGQHKLKSYVCSNCKIDYLTKWTGGINNNFCSKKCGEDFRAKERYADYTKKVYEMYHGAKSRAKRDNKQFDLTLGFLEDLWNKTNGCCSVSGRKFVWGPSKDRISKDAPTIDRIDSNKGYTKDNVRLITYHLNIAINKYGLDSFLELAKEVISRGR
jgi:hypothetical protein